MLVTAHPCASRLVLMCSAREVFTRSCLGVARLPLSDSRICLNRFWRVCMQARIQSTGVFNRCRRRSRLELSVTDSGASQKELPSGCLPGSGLFRSSPIFEIESAARVGGAVGGIQKRCICELQEPCAVSRTSGGGSRGEVPAL